MQRPSTRTGASDLTTTIQNVALNRLPIYGESGVLDAYNQSGGRTHFRVNNEGQLEYWRSNATKHTPFGLIKLKAKFKPVVQSFADGQWPVNGQVTALIPSAKGGALALINGQLFQLSVDGTAQPWQHANAHGTIVDAFTRNNAVYFVLKNATVFKGYPDNSQPASRVADPNVPDSLATGERLFFDNQGVWWRFQQNELARFNPVTKQWQSVSPSAEGVDAYQSVTISETGQVFGFYQDDNQPVQENVRTGQRVDPAFSTRQIDARLNDAFTFAAIGANGQQIILGVGRSQAGELTGYIEAAGTGKDQPAQRLPVIFPDGQPVTGIERLRAGIDGKIYYVQEGKVYSTAVENGRWTTPQEIDSGSTLNALDIAVDNDGKTAILLADGTLIGANQTELQVTTDGTAGKLTQIAYDNDGLLWAITDQGALFKYNSNGDQLFSSLDTAESTGTIIPKFEQLSTAAKDGLIRVVDETGKGYFIGSSIESRELPSALAASQRPNLPGKGQVVRVPGGRWTETFLGLLPLGHTVSGKTKNFATVLFKEKLNRNILNSIGDYFSAHIKTPVKKGAKGLWRIIQNAAQAEGPILTQGNSGRVYQELNQFVANSAQYFEGKQKVSLTTSDSSTQSIIAENAKIVAEIKQLINYDELTRPENRPFLDELKNRVRDNKIFGANNLVFQLAESPVLDESTRNLMNELLELGIIVDAKSPGAVLQAKLLQNADTLRRIHENEPVDTAAITDSAISKAYAQGFRSLPEMYNLEKAVKGLSGDLQNPDSELSKAWREVTGVEKAAGQAALVTAIKNKIAALPVGESLTLSRSRGVEVSLTGKRAISRAVGPASVTLYAGPKGHWKVAPSLTLSKKADGSLGLSISYSRDAGGGVGAEFIAGGGIPGGLSVSGVLGAGIVGNQVRTATFSATIPGQNNFINQLTGGDLSLTDIRSQAVGQGTVNRKTVVGVSASAYVNAGVNAPALAVLEDTPAKAQFNFSAKPVRGEGAINVNRASSETTGANGVEGANNSNSRNVSVGYGIMPFYSGVVFGQQDADKFRPLEPYYKKIRTLTVLSDNLSINLSFETDTVLGNSAQRVKAVTVSESLNPSALATGKLQDVTTRLQGLLSRNPEDAALNTAVNKVLEAATKQGGNLSLSYELTAEGVRQFNQEGNGQQWLQRIHQESLQNTNAHTDVLRIKSVSLGSSASHATSGGAVIVAGVVSSGSISESVSLGSVSFKYDSSSNQPSLDKSAGALFVDGVSGVTPGVNPGDSNIGDTGNTPEDISPTETQERLTQWLDNQELIDQFQQRLVEIDPELTWRPAPQSVLSIDTDSPQRSGLSAAIATAWAQASYLDGQDGGNRAQQLLDNVFTLGAIRSEELAGPISDNDRTVASEFVDSLKQLNAQQSNHITENVLANGLSNPLGELTPSALVNHFSAQATAEGETYLLSTRNHTMAVTVAYGENGWDIRFNDPLVGEITGIKNPQQLETLLKNHLADLGVEFQFTADRVLVEKVNHQALAESELNGLIQPHFTAIETTFNKLQALDTAEGKLTINGQAFSRVELYQLGTLVDGKPVDANTDFSNQQTLEKITFRHDKLQAYIKGQDTGVVRKVYQLTAFVADQHITAGNTGEVIVDVANKAHWLVQQRQQLDATSRSFEQAKQVLAAAKQDGLTVELAPTGNNNRQVSLSDVLAVAQAEQSGDVKQLLDNRNRAAFVNDLVQQGKANEAEKKALKGFNNAHSQLADSVKTDPSYQASAGTLSIHDIAKKISADGDQALVLKNGKQHFLVSKRNGSLSFYDPAVGWVSGFADGPALQTFMTDYFSDLTKLQYGQATGSFTVNELKPGFFDDAKNITASTQLKDPITVEIETLSQLDIQKGPLLLGGQLIDGQQISRVTLWQMGALVDGKFLNSASFTDESWTRNLTFDPKVLKQHLRTVSDADFKVSLEAIKAVANQKRVKPVNLADEGSLPSGLRKLLNGLDNPNLTLDSNNIQSLRKDLGGRLTLAPGFKTRAAGTGLQAFGIYSGIKGAHEAFKKGDTTEGFIQLGALYAEAASIPLEITLERTLPQIGQRLVAYSAGSTGRFAAASSRLGSTLGRGASFVAGLVTLPFDIYSAYKAFSDAGQADLSDKERQDLYFQGSLAVAGAAVSLGLGVAALFSATAASFAGPAGIGLGVLLVGISQGYAAYRTVEHLQEYLTSSDFSAFKEGARTFFFLGPSEATQEKLKVNQTNINYLTNSLEHSRKILNDALADSIGAVIYGNTDVAINEVTSTRFRSNTPFFEQISSFINLNGIEVDPSKVTDELHNIREVALKDGDDHIDVREGIQNLSAKVQVNGVIDREDRSTILDIAIRNGFNSQAAYSAAVQSSNRNASSIEREMNNLIVQFLYEAIINNKVDSEKDKKDFIRIAVKNNVVFPPAAIGDGFNSNTDKGVQFNLGGGNDIVYGVKNRTNMLVFGQGEKELTGGDLSDTFAFSTNLRQLKDFAENRNADDGYENINFSLDGGKGEDTLVLNPFVPQNDNSATPRFAGFIVDLGAGKVWLRNEGQTGEAAKGKEIGRLSNIEHTTGSVVGNDIVYGSDDKNILVANRGDTVFARGGDDLVTITDRADVDGGAGNDVYVVQRGVVDASIKEDGVDVSVIRLEYGLNEIADWQRQGKDLVIIFDAKRSISRGSSNRQLMIKDVYSETDSGLSLVNDKLSFQTKDGFMLTPDLAKEVSADSVNKVESIKLHTRYFKAADQIYQNDLIGITIDLNENRIDGDNVIGPQSEKELAKLNRDELVVLGSGDSLTGDIEEATFLIERGAGETVVKVNPQENPAESVKTFYLNYDDSEIESIQTRYKPSYIKHRNGYYLLERQDYAVVVTMTGGRQVVFENIIDATTHNSSGSYLSGGKNLWDFNIITRDGVEYGLEDQSRGTYVTLNSKDLLTASHYEDKNFEGIQYIDTRRSLNKKEHNSYHWQWGDGRRLDDRYQLTAEGTGGNDRLLGSDNADVVRGYGGNDYMEGRNGHDTYVIGSQKGAVTINNQATDNKLDSVVVNAAINDIKTRREGDHLVLVARLPQPDGQGNINFITREVTLKHYFVGEAYQHISIVSNDGHLQQLVVDEQGNISRLIILSEEGNEAIIGNSGTTDNIIKGTAKNDKVSLAATDLNTVISTENGDDVIKVASSGYDVIQGGEGDDQYQILEASRGVKVINNVGKADEEDVLVLDQVSTLNNLVLAKSTAPGNFDLHILVRDDNGTVSTADSAEVIIKNYFVPGGDQYRHISLMLADEDITADQLQQLSKAAVYREGLTVVNDDSAEQPATALSGQSDVEATNNTNRAVQLNKQGNDSYLSSSRFALAGAKEFTIEARFASDQQQLQSNNYVPILSYAVEGSANELVLGVQPKGLNVWLKGKEYETAIPVEALLDGQFHNVTISRNRAGQLDIYIDGQLRDSVMTDGKPLAGGGQLVFGQEQDKVGGDFDSNQVFKGRYDDIKFYNTALTEDQVNNPIARESYTLVSHWAFDQLEDNRVEDVTREGNDLQLQQVAESSNVALQLNTQGNDSYLSSQRFALAGAKAFTVEARFASDRQQLNTNDYVPIVSYASPGSTNELLLGVHPGGLNIWIKTKQYTTSVTADELLDGNYHQVAISRNSDGKLDIYVDGQLRDSVATDGEALADTDQGLLVLGQEQDNQVGEEFDPNQVLQGRYEDIKFYNTALTDEQINNPDERSQQNLVSHWTFDQLDNNQVVDTTGRGNDLQLQRVSGPEFTQATAPVTQIINADQLIQSMAAFNGEEWSSATPVNGYANATANPALVVTTN